MCPKMFPLPKTFFIINVFNQSNYSILSTILVIWVKVFVENVLTCFLLLNLLLNLMLNFTLFKFKYTFVIVYIRYIYIERETYFLIFFQNIYDMWNCQCNTRNYLFFIQRRAQWWAKRARNKIMSHGWSI